jgi:type II secretory pathway component PulL
MTTELLIEQIRGHWWIWLFVICMTSYFIYSLISDYVRLKRVKEKKKDLEKELVGLEAKYADQAKKLEDKMKERKKFLKGGQK